jgi:hypothetical protein
LPLHLRLLIGRAPNNNNRPALPAIHLARTLRAIRPTGRLHREPLLATEALTPAGGGSRCIGRGSRAEQTNNQNDETEYSHGLPSLLNDSQRCSPATPSRQSRPTIRWVTEERPFATAQITSIGGVSWNVMCLFCAPALSA